MEELQELKCSICFDRYNETNRCPLILICCGNTICSGCFEKVQKEQSPKCPMCREITQSQTPKKNIGLLKVIAKHLIFGECPTHGDMPIRYLCKKDNQQLCEKCLLTENHRGHETQDIKPLKETLAKKLKTLEKKEAAWIQYQKSQDKLLEKRRDDQLRTINEKFESLEVILKQRLLSLRDKITQKYEHKQNEPRSAPGKKPLLKQPFQGNKENQKTKTSSSLYKDADQKPLKFDSKLAEEDSLSNMINTDATVLKASLEEQRLKMSSLDLSQEHLLLNNPSKVADGGLYGSLEILQKKSSFAVTSRFKLTVNSQTLIIKLESDLNKDCVIDMEAWKHIKNIEFVYQKLDLNDNDLWVLDYIFTKLINVQSIHLAQRIEEAWSEEEDQEEDDEADEDYNNTLIAKFMRTLFLKQQELRSIKLELCLFEEGVQIIRYLGANILPNIQAEFLREFDLVFWSTCTLGNSFTDLLKHLSSICENLEYLRLQLPEVSIRHCLSENPLNLPKLADFTLEINCGEDLDDQNDTNSFLVSSLQSMECLKNLSISLFTCQFDEDSIQNLFYEVENIPALKYLSLILNPEKFGHVIAVTDMDYVNLYHIGHLLGESFSKMTQLERLSLGYYVLSSDVKGYQRIKKFLEECERKFRMHRDHGIIIVD